MLTCAATRDALLEAPDSPSVEVRAHLKRCAECRSIQRDWQAVDRAIRSQPLPPSAISAREAFLAQLDPVAEPARPRRARKHWLEWSLAACLFLAIGVVTFFISSPSEVQAKPKLVEELVEWNVKLAETESREVRTALAEQRLPEFQQALLDPRLSSQDRQLANRLIEEAQWQAKSEDPLEVAERLHGLADEMLTMAEQAAPTPERSAAFVKLTGQLADRGVSKAARRAAAKEARDEARLARLAAAQQHQAAKMAAVAERVGAATGQHPARKKGKKFK